MKFKASVALNDMNVTNYSDDDSLNFVYNELRIKCYHKKLMIFILKCSVVLV